MAADRPHIPHKFRQPSANRGVRGIVRNALGKQGGEANEESLTEMLDRLAVVEEKRNKDNWLEVERWGDRMIRSVSGEYDAYIDPTIEFAKPSEHTYPNLTSLIQHETWGEDYNFRVGVIPDGLPVEICT